MRPTLRLFAALAIGCTRQPAPHPDAPPPDAADGAPKATAETACANLALLGCPEATPQKDCVQAIANDSVLQAVPLACWTNARSVDAAQRCGGFRCVP